MSSALSDVCIASSDICIVGHLHCRTFGGEQVQFDPLWSREPSPGRIPTTRRATSRPDTTSISSPVVFRPKYPAISAFGPKRRRCGSSFAVSLPPSSAMSTNLAPSLSGGAINLADQRYGIFALSLDGAVGNCTCSPPNVRQCKCPTMQMSDII